MLHGFKVPKDPSQHTQSDSLSEVVPLFGNPEDYTRLSEEERNDLTEKMLQKHKQWSKRAL